MLLIIMNCFQCNVTIDVRQNKKKKSKFLYNEVTTNQKRNLRPCTQKQKDNLAVKFSKYVNF